MRNWHQRLGAVTAAACVPLAGVLPASAATASGWQIAYTVPARSYQIDGLIAPATNDAWAFGLHYSGDVFRSSFYLRWTGHGWHLARVPQPAGFAAEQISSSSPDNVWILGSTPTGYMALVYNGEWRSMVAPGDGPLAVLASNDVWVQAGIGCTAPGPSLSCTTWLDHWDGTRWTSYTLPVYGLALVGTGHRVWFAAAADLKQAGPPSEIGREALFRWSGSRWQPVRAPDGEIVGDMTAAASPGGQLWLLAGSVHTTRLHLDYWNGHRWSQAATAGNGPYSTFALTYDGHNGVWDGSEHWTGTRWIQTLPPGTGPAIFGVSYTAHIPGTASVWGVAQARLNERSVIAVYGHLP